MKIEKVKKDEEEGEEERREKEENKKMKELSRRAQVLSCSALANSHRVLGLIGSVRYSNMLYLAIIWNYFPDVA